MHLSVKPFVMMNSTGGKKTTQDETRLAWALSIMNAVAKNEEIAEIKNTNPKIKDTRLLILAQLLEDRLVSRIMQTESLFGKPVQGKTYIPGLETRIKTSLINKWNLVKSGTKTPLPDFTLKYRRKDERIDDLKDWFNLYVKKTKRARSPPLSSSSSSKKQQFNS